MCMLNITFSLQRFEVQFVMQFLTAVAFALLDFILIFVHFSNEKQVKNERAIINYACT